MSDEYGMKEPEGMVEKQRTPTPLASGLSRQGIRVPD
jgi:hypothetical protein